MNSRGGPSQGCPSVGRLASLLTADPGAAAVGRHVEGCSACRAALEALRRDEEFLATFGRAIRGQADEAPAPVATGAVQLPGYRIIAELARGGQGIVFKAVQEATRRTVVIKLPLSAGPLTGRDRYRFEREIQSAASMRHPNVVSIFESGITADGRGFVAMEFVDGERIDHYVARLRTSGRDGADVTRLILCLCETVAGAVQHAHSRGIIHRDLKPANILVDREGHPRIVDFGLARRVVDWTATATQEFVGTPAYASPEQVSGDPSTIDVRSDVYSLGVVMYELLLGRLPYAVEGSLGDMVRAITTAEAARPATVALAPGQRRMDAELESIVLKCLHKDPLRRYQTAAELCDDLGRYLAGRPILARRDSAWYVLTKFAKRRKSLVIAIAGAAAALVLGGAGAVYGLLRAKDATQQATVEAARAEAEEVSSRTAAQLIRQTLMPLEGSPDDLTLGRHVRTGLTRLQARLELGSMAGDVRAESSARELFAAISMTPAGAAVSESALRYNIAALASVRGERSAAVADALYNLAVVLEMRGRLQEAEATVRSSIASHRVESAGGAGAALELLGRVLVRLGRPAEAMAPLSEALRVAMEGGSEAGVRVRALVARGRLLRAQGEHDRAGEDCSAALVESLAFLDDLDAGTAEALMAEAEQYRAYPAGISHDAVMKAMGTPTRAATGEALAAIVPTLHGRGTTEAECLARAAALESLLAVKAALLGADHEACAGTLCLIAIEHQSIGDLHGVARAVERIIQNVGARLGPDHISLAQPHEWLSMCFNALEDHPARVRAHERIVDIWEHQPAAARSAVWLASEHRWLAEALAMAGEYDRAETEFRVAAGGLAESGLADHYLNDICEGGRAWAMAHLGRTEAAVALARAALGRYEQRPGAPADQRWWLQRILGHVLIARKEWSEAGPILEEARVGLATPAARNSRSFAVLEDCLVCAEQAGDGTRALELREELAQLRRAVRKGR